MRRSLRGSPRGGDDMFPDRITLPYERAHVLRYGENPDQRAAFYVERPGAGLDALDQRGGKELSFNNLLDLEGALVAADPFRAAGEMCCAIIKHTTPCGLATGATCDRSVPEGAGMRSDVGVRIGDRIYGSGGRCGRRCHLESVRGMHRGALVHRERSRDPRPQEEPAYPGGFGGVGRGRAWISSASGAAC